MLRDLKIFHELIRNRLLPDLTPGRRILRPLFRASLRPHFSAQNAPQPPIDLLERGPGASPFSGAFGPLVGLGRAFVKAF